VCGNSSLGGLKVHGRLSGVALNAAEYPPGLGAMPKECERPQGKGLLVGVELVTEVEALSTTASVAPKAEVRKPVSQGD
jgi:hypothetical protein